MPQFTVYGKVMKAIAQDLGVRVDNQKELREFWRCNKVDTKLDWFDQGAPVYSIGRQRDIAACKPGDRVAVTFETQDRSNGKRGVRTVKFKVLS